MKKKVVIMGCGGHGKVVADIIKKSGDIVEGFLDDYNDSFPGVIGRIDDCVKYEDCCFVIAIGDNDTRQKIQRKYGDLKFYTAIHPCAVIGENVSIGNGTVVMANAVINSDTMIGMHCIINTGSTVEHDNKISDFVHVSPGAVLCGTVSVGEKTHIGAGAVVINNISIEKNTVVGAGAVVVKNIENSGTYIGVPAMERK